MMTELTQEQLLAAVMALEADVRSGLRSERLERQVAVNRARDQLEAVRSQMRVSGWRFALRFAFRRRKYLQLVEIEMQALNALADAFDAVEEAT